MNLNVCIYICNIYMYLCIYIHIYIFIFISLTHPVLFHIADPWRNRSINHMIVIQFPKEHRTGLWGQVRPHFQMKHQAKYLCRYSAVSCYIEQLPLFMLLEPYEPTLSKLKEKNTSLRCHSSVCTHVSKA